jgi:hypothetical protein
MSEHVIPSNAVIPCPEISFRARFASSCADCQHFGGIVDVQPNAATGTPANVRYRVICGHPIARRFELIEGAVNAGA